MPVSINNTEVVFNDATTQTTSGVTSIGTGTGISSTGGKTPTLTNTGVTSVSGAGTVSVSASSGAVTITGTGITSAVTSLNGQTGAVTNTSVDAIGSYIVGVNAVNIPANTTMQAFTAGTTVSGSTLRYNYGSNYTAFAGGGYSSAPFTGNATAVWNQGGSALSGTWRVMGKMGNSNTFDTDSQNINASWAPSMFVRIS